LTPIMGAPEAPCVLLLTGIPPGLWARFRHKAKPQSIVSMLRSRLGVTSLLTCPPAGQASLLPMISSRLEAAPA
jgi:hypothetical protein